MFNSTASNPIFNHNPHQPPSNPLTTFTHDHLIDSLGVGNLRDKKSAVYPL